MNHLGTRELATERLTLRRFEIEDAENMFYNWASDPEVSKYLTWPAHNSPEVTKAVLEDWVTSYQRDDYYQWMIQLKDSNIGPIGSISVVSLDDKASKAEIGYCIGKAWWHQGITTEALGAVIGYLFNKTGIQRIEARHDVNNPHSGAVMRKCGMQLMGIAEKADKNNQGVCDCATYAIMK